MSDEDGTTTGVWFGKGDGDLLEDFDEEFAAESRSEKIKDAMRMYLAIEQTLDELDFDMDETSKRHWVQQAIRTEGSRAYDE